MVSAKWSANINEKPSVVEASRPVLAPGIQQEKVQDHRVIPTLQGENKALESVPLDLAPAGQEAPVQYQREAPVLQNAGPGLAIKRNGI